LPHGTFHAPLLPLSPGAVSKGMPPVSHSAAAAAALRCSDMTPEGGSSSNCMLLDTLANAAESRSCSSIAPATPRSTQCDALKNLVGDQGHGEDEIIRLLFDMRNADSADAAEMASTRVSVRLKKSPMITMGFPPQYSSSAGVMNSDLLHFMLYASLETFSKGKEYEQAARIVIECARAGFPDNVIRGAEEIVGIRSDLIGAWRSMNQIYTRLIDVHYIAFVLRAAVRYSDICGAQVRLDPSWGVSDFARRGCVMNMGETLGETVRELGVHLRHHGLLMRLYAGMEDKAPVTPEELGTRDFVRPDEPGDTYRALLKLLEVNRARVSAAQAAAFLCGYLSRVPADADEGCVGAAMRLMISMGEAVAAPVLAWAEAQGAASNVFRRVFALPAPEMWSESPVVHLLRGSDEMRRRVLRANLQSLRIANKEQVRALVDAVGVGGSEEVAQEARESLVTIVCTLLLEQTDLRGRFELVSTWAQAAINTTKKKKRPRARSPSSSSSSSPDPDQQQQNAKKARQGGQDGQKEGV
jgi:hypothetical protein